MVTYDNRRNKLVILSPGFPKDEGDSSCLPAIHQLVRSLAELRGSENIIVLAFQYPFEKREYSWHGIRVIALGGANRPGVLRLLTWFTVFKALRKLMRYEKIGGLLACWLTECAYVAKQFAKKKGLKYFFWLQGQDAREGNAYVKRVKPESSELIAISDFTSDEFLRNYGIRPFITVENGIVPGNFPELNRSARTIHVLGAGSLIPLKNYSLFLEVICGLKKKFPQVKAELIGTGPEETSLRLMVRELGLQDNIHFTGKLGHAEVLSHMNNSKVLLHTSNYEGNPGVVLEALYSGCRVVTRRDNSKTPTQNLFIADGKDKLIQTVAELLQDESPAERVLVNSMNDTASVISRLFPG